MVSFGGSELVGVFGSDPAAEAKAEQRSGVEYGGDGGINNPAIWSDGCRYVSEDRAMAYTAWWAGVTAISCTAAALPLSVFERTAVGRSKIWNHPVSRLLDDEPNTETDALAFREAIFSHAINWGNGYAEIERDRQGNPLSLWLITPDRVRPRRDFNGALYYEVGPRGYSLGYYSQDGAFAEVPAADMFHLKGFGYDGLVGYNPVRLFNEALQMGVSAEKYGVAWFDNNVRPGGFIKHPGKPSKETREQIRNDFVDFHSGAGKAGRIGMLWEGMDFSPYNVPPEVALFLDTRRYQISEIARILRVPPSILYELSESHYDNLEGLREDFRSFTMLGWLQRFEREARRKLLPVGGNLYIRHNFDGLLRADIQKRFAAYAVARQWGWLCVDEIRELEDRDPLPEGKGQVWLEPLNMKPAGEETPAPTEPPPPGNYSELPNSSPDPHPPEPPAQRSSTPAGHDADEQAELRAKLRGAIASTIGRSVRREVAKLKGLGGDRGRIFGHLDHFYSPEQAGEWLRRDLEPVVDAARAAMRVAPFDLDAWCADYCRRARQFIELQADLDGDADGLPRRLQILYELLPSIRTEDEAALLANALTATEA